MTPTTDENLVRLLAAIREVTTPERVYLFGSRATGTAREDSDYDVLVLTNDQRPRHEVARDIRVRLYGADLSLDLFVMSPTEYERWRPVAGTLARIVDRTGVALVA